jgi:hypothetical protein
MNGDGGSRTHDLLVASEVLCHQSFVPERFDADGWSRTTTARGTRFTAGGAHPCSAPASWGGRSDSNRYLRGSQPRMLRYTTATMNTGTTGFEPASSRLTNERSAQLSYAPGWGGRRDRLPATGGRDVTVLGLRSQLLLIGTPASACPRRHLLTGWPWRLSEASCTLGPALCTSPSSVTSLARPSTRQS